MEYKLATVGALLGVLIVPLLARAAFFSFSGLFQATSKSQASVTPLNSQTMALLAPATNVDPRPPVEEDAIAVVDGLALQADNNPGGGTSIESTGASQISIHVVKGGDTLSGIAELYGVSINTIIWANDIKGRYIQPGQELVILPITGVRHTVVKGETIASIAKKYQGDFDEIASYNELAADAALAVGDVVIIPDGVVAPPPAPRSSGSGTAGLRSAGGPAAASGYYGWPVDGGYITQGIHGYNGIDIGAPQGTNIYAAAAGTVIVARSGGYNSGYGSYVVVQHDNGTQTLYGHASEVLVAPGEKVGKGQVIAKVGHTGKVSGPTGNHLHFEVRGASNPFR